MQPMTLVPGHSPDLPLETTDCQEVDEVHHWWGGLDDAARLQYMKEQDFSQLIKGQCDKLIHWCYELSDDCVKHLSDAETTEGGSLPPLSRNGMHALMVRAREDVDFFKPISDLHDHKRVEQERKQQQQQQHGTFDREDAMWAYVSVAVAVVIVTMLSKIMYRNQRIKHAPPKESSKEE